MGKLSPVLGAGIRNLSLLFSDTFSTLPGIDEKEYLSGIPKTQAEFESQWTTLASRIANDLKNDSELRMNDLTGQLARLRAEADANEAERECSRQKIRNTSYRLSLIETELRNLGGWSHERNAAASN